MAIQQQLQVQIILSSGVAIEGWYTKFEFKNTKDPDGMRVTEINYKRVTNEYPSLQFVDLNDIRAIVVTDIRGVEVFEVPNVPAE